MPGGPFRPPFFLAREVLALQNLVILKESSGGLAGFVSVGWKVALSLAHRAIRRHLSSFLLAALLAGVCACRVAPGPKPIFRSDLRPYGFPTQTQGRILGSFSDISFLSGDLVLVTVNTRNFAAEDSDASDEPESRLLLFDLSKRALRQTAELPVEKAKDSVQSAGNDSFVLLNRAGVQICSSDLECGAPVPTREPLFVSPQGSHIAVGGRTHWEQKLLDGKTLAEQESFAANEPRVIPGDHALLYVQKGKLYVRKLDQPEPQFVVEAGNTGVWPEARFLNGTTIAVLQSDKEMAIVTLEGKTIARVPVSAGSFLAEVSTAASGTRFCFHDAGYRGLGALLNFLSIERPFNLERVNVMDTATGKSRFRLRWDPRPYVGDLSRPALSPDGHRVALIRHGFLEVFEIR